MKKSILFVYPEMMLGGSTTSLINLLNKLDRKKYKIDLILYKNKGELIDLIPKDINILKQAYKYDNINRIRKISKIKMKNIYFCLRSINKIIDNRIKSQVLAKFQVDLSRKVENEYDIVISFLELWANYYAIDKCKAKTKILWYHVDYEKSRYSQDIDNIYIKQADFVATVSKEGKEKLKKIFYEYKDKIITIENTFSKDLIIEKGLLKRDDLLLDNNFFNILTVSRIDIETKGLDRIVKILRKLIEDGLKIKWYILGGGEELNKLASCINKYNLNKNLILLGAKKNPYPYFKGFDLFVLPSRTEGKPMSVLEAQALQIPPLVTNYLAASEQIISGVDGVIVKNDEESIYREIKNLIENKHKLIRLKKNLKIKKFEDEKGLIGLYKIINEGKYYE